MKNVKDVRYVGVDAECTLADIRSLQHQNFAGMVIGGFMAIFEKHKWNKFAASNFVKGYLQQCKESTNK